MLYLALIWLISLVSIASLLSDNFSFSRTENAWLYLIKKNIFSWREEEDKYIENQDYSARKKYRINMLMLF